MYVLTLNRKNMKRIQTTVKWMTEDGESHSLSFPTRYKARGFKQDLERGKKALWVELH